MINRLKWASTFFILVGILLTNLNIYPLNIFVHGTGAIGWTMVGYMMADRAILTNFGLQIPLFIIGNICLLYTSPSPRDLSTSRMPSSA